MKNSIEEDIKILKEFKTHGYAMLLMKYEDRNKTNLKIDQAIEHILSDYKRVLKENEELKDKYATFVKTSCEIVEQSIPIQKVKDNLIKYQEEYELLLEHQSGKESNRTKYLRGRIHMCQELLESEE